MYILQKINVIYTDEDRDVNDDTQVKFAFISRKKRIFLSTFLVNSYCYLLSTENQWSSGKQKQGESERAYYGISTNHS